MSLPDELNLGSVLHGKPEAGVAVIDVSGPRSYAALDQDGSAFARGLTARGLGPGSRIALVSGNRPEFLAAFFGAMRAGCTVAPISTRQSRDTMRSQLERLSPDLVIGEAEFRDENRGYPDWISFEDGWSALLRPGSFQATRPGPDDVAMLLFTSGSTGRPRGVRLTHRGQIWFLNTLLDATGRAKETALVAAPLFHGNALIRVMCAFATGGTIVLQRRFEPSAYVDAIGRYGVTLLTGVPTMFAMLLERPDLLGRADLSSVRRIMMGSAGASAALADDVAAVFPAATIGLAYGLTEAGGTVCSTLCRPGGAASPPGSVGFMLPGIEARISGSAKGESGVLLLRSPAVAAGYDSEPEQSAARFRDGWLDTGDVMRRDEDGAWRFIGRADDMFVCGGENVYPAEIEALIEAHPQVQQAAVLPRPHRIKGQVPVAFVVLRPGAEVSEAEIQEHVLRTGPAYLHPRQVTFIPVMPLSGTQKIDRAALKLQGLKDTPQPLRHRADRAGAPRTRRLR